MRLVYRLLSGLLLSMTLFGSPASAKLHPVTHEQIEIALKAFVESAKAAATRGRSVRGASGSIIDLLTSADTTMCTSWEIQWKLIHQDLAQELAFPDDTDHEARLADAVQKGNKVHDLISRYCDRVINADAYPPAPPTSGTLTTPTPASEECDAECQRKRETYYAALKAYWAQAATCRDIKIRSGQI